MGNLFFNQDIKTNPSKQKADTNKSNGNARWWRTSKRKDPNVIDVDALTMKERGMLLRQGKCFRCKKTYGKRLPIGTRRVVKEEGRPSKVGLYHN
jgi:hypothetical protein